jgi:pimeloyl-ACP methyl ester carboxylesterase
MLLFLPGLACDARIYAPQLAAFPDSRAVDGYGTADSLQAMARLALDEAPDAFDLFGHSMGGRVALEVWRLAPERVRRLALVSTGVHSLREGEPEKRAALQAIGWNHGYAKLIDEWLPPMVADGNRAKPEVYGPLRQMNLDAGQAVFDAQIRALVNRAEMESLLPRIACPTLVMTGEFDSWSPPRAAPGDRRRHSEFGTRDRSGRWAHGPVRSARCGQRRYRPLARKARVRSTPQPQPHL